MSLTVHAQEGSLGVKKEGCYPITGDGKPPTGLRAGIHLGEKMRIQMGADPRAGQMWEKK